ncbi:MAG: 1-acyl-sn-glycerol-3-phosphate acyltransferase [Candidatus Methylomirabilis sp.]|nr:1-acyl-sn-glycerol-3-phosphate acyltransferase [Deltaproteobacteria bacterium]
MIQLDREKTVQEVRSRVLSARIKDSVARKDAALEYVINETLFLERQRLKEEPRSNKLRESDLAFYKKVSKRLGKASEKEKVELLGAIVERFAWEIVGNFSQPTYEFATRVLPRGLSVILNGLSPRVILKNFPHLPGVERNLKVQGEIGRVQALTRKGTVILLPTHLSNMDSPLIGFAIYMASLPPFVYGAGLNLFTNPVMSFFMHRLGAYKVDRKKRAPLYKEVLKEYSTYVIERGMHSLFFPGGTRSRSGGVERHLKLGLAGTGLAAYINNLRRKTANPNVYFVPATISYQLVLEAETLVDDFLKEVGKSRYIIEDDESSRLKRMADFVTNLLELDSRIYVTFLKPLDPFGNDVDEAGRSVDSHGRPIDIRRYVLAGSGPDHDDARDREYTAELGERVADAFSRGNVVQSTNLVAFAAFELMCEAAKEEDLYKLLRSEDRALRIGREDLGRRVESVLEAVMDLVDHGKIRVSESIERGKAEAVLKDGEQHFSLYHTAEAISRVGDYYQVGDPKLLYYYRNRLTGYHLGEHFHLKAK